MRIAILGSVALSVPPQLSGGTEWIAYYQARGLLEKGHEIILFAAKGDTKNFNSNIKLIEIGKGDIVTGSAQEKKFDSTLTEGSRELRLEMVYLSEVAQKLIDLKDSYDIMLNNMRGEAIFLPIAKMLNKPFVSVMHLNIFSELSELFQNFKTSIITISNAQRKDFPNLSYLATVYNGVDISQFSYNDNPADYYLMVGSIGRHKNQGDAIRVYKETGNKLILIGKIRDKDYYEEIKKDIDGVQIIYKREVGFEEKIKLYQGAKGLLFPILWEEPFGLVMIEAMSCRTPVIAYSHGAISEVLINNKTGYIVENISQMIEKINKVDQINRRDCRKHVEENFTVEKMVNGYEKALLSIYNS